MELRRLELENFRQFENETITFAKGEDKGVTVIHGSNGAGKTTLLNAFTWLFYDNVGFESGTDRLANEGTVVQAQPGEELTVTVELRFTHEGQEFRARREAIYEKRSGTDFNTELIDMDLTVEVRSGGTWDAVGNPSNRLDQIIPERLSNLFFFDGEDIKELTGPDNQDRIQESIQNIMGLTILERATRHLDAVAGRFEDQVRELASEELTGLIEQKRSVESEIDDLERKHNDTERAKEQVTNEISDIELKLERLDESAALQERREEYRTERKKLEERLETVNELIRTEINDKGFAPLAMPLIQDTAEELDDMRKEGLIPSELSNSYIESLLESGHCFCGRSLEPGTDHYQKVEAMKGDTVADGVEQSALRIIGHLNQFSEMESSLFDDVDELVAERKSLHEEIEEWTERIDDVSSQLQEMDVTTESGESISELETKREEKEGERETLINELGRIEQQIEEKKERVAELETQIDDKRDEREDALLAKRRQRAAELVEEELDDAFEGLKDKVRKLSNQKIKETFNTIARKDFTAEINENFELKIRQDVQGEQAEVAKSTGETQITSLAFIGSLVDIARDQYETNADSEYFTGGIYPLVMDSPFGALDNKHREEIGRIIPTLANQVVVFATDSQWDGPVEEQMSPHTGQQYWLDFDEGDGEQEYPRTRIRSGQNAVRGD